MISAEENAQSAQNMREVLYRAIAVPQSVSGRTQDISREAEHMGTICAAGPKACDDIRSIYLKLPETTRAALVQAQGALERTVYTANDGHDTAFLLGFHRPHTAQEKLCAFSGCERLRNGLVEYAALHAIHDSHTITVKTEPGVYAKQAMTTYDGRSWRPLGEHEHYRQTTEFTCGPVSLLNAMHRLHPQVTANRVDELHIWREATIAVACEPYGLALSAMKRGEQPRIIVSKTGPVLNPADGAMGMLDTAMSLDVQEHFATQAHVAGIPVEVMPFTAADVVKRLDGGHVALVLIDEHVMHGEICPHWVTVTGMLADGTLLVDDPWIDEPYGETLVDAYQLPIRQADFDLMIHYDEPASAQAMIIL
ncbi:peptidase_C39-like family protein [Bifidobacterium thermophilum]|nr:peptidase_C39-like family protein [Bifidobacterium thermophilum]